MKRTTIITAACLSMLAVHTPPVCSQNAAVFHYMVEIDLTNDQGDMPTIDYLRDYGTKGKKRAVEFIYEVINPYLTTCLEKAGYHLLPLDTVSSVKSNEYGFPSASLKKAIESGIADLYIRIHLKDISLLSFAGADAADPFQNQKKIVRMRCRIQVYNSSRKMIRDAEGVFQSGEKIENPDELGVDLRKYQGSSYLQELKIYETCSKMAICRVFK